jgi:hypothetical protein
VLWTREGGHHTAGLADESALRRELLAFFCSESTRREECDAQR